MGEMADREVLLVALGADGILSGETCSGIGNNNLEEEKHTCPIISNIFRSVTNLRIFRIRGLVPLKH